MATEPVIVFCTAPEGATAREIAERLVQENLVACVNILPGITSVYQWKGAIESDSENLMLMKTTRDRFDALSALVRKLHPYELPEVVAVPVTTGLPDYLHWIIETTRPHSL